MEIEIKAVYSFNPQTDNHEKMFEFWVGKGLVGIFSKDDLFTILKVILKEPLMPPPPPKPI